MKLLHSLGPSVSAVLGVLGTGVLLIETNILLDLSSAESFPLASEDAVPRRELSEVYEKNWHIIIAQEIAVSIRYFHTYIEIGNMRRGTILLSLPPDRFSQESQ